MEYELIKGAGRWPWHVRAFNPANRCGKELPFRSKKAALAFIAAQ